MDKLAFLNAKVRSLPLPPVKNIFNVAVQTARQTMPEKPNKGDYTEPNGAPPVPPRPQNVHFSDDMQTQQQPQRMEHHELNPFGASNTNPFSCGGDGGGGGGGTDGQESTSFMGDYEQGYQRSETYMNR